MIAFNFFHHLVQTNRSPLRNFAFLATNAAAAAGNEAALKFKSTAPRHFWESRVEKSIADECLNESLLLIHSAEVLTHVSLIRLLTKLPAVPIEHFGFVVPHYISVQPLTFLIEWNRQIFYPGSNSGPLIQVLLSTCHKAKIINQDDHIPLYQQFTLKTVRLGVQHSQWINAKYNNG